MDTIYAYKRVKSFHSIKLIVGCQKKVYNDVKDNTIILIKNVVNEK